MNVFISAMNAKPQTVFGKCNGCSKSHLTLKATCKCLSSDLFAILYMVTSDVLVSCHVSPLT